jgi:phosphorylated CTD-interacting factor 1
MARHVETHAAVTGDGARVAASVRNAKARLWDLSLGIPKAVPPVVRVSLAVSPACAAALELESAKALRALHRELADLCKERGMRGQIRALTLERWRFDAKREEESEQKKKQNLHPVLPSRATPTANKELATELGRQGLGAADAGSVVAALSKSCIARAARLLKMTHQVVSGRPLKAPQISMVFNRHNVDLKCGRTLVKVSRAAYGKLSILHRRHAPAGEASPAPDAAGDAHTAAELDASESAEVEAAIATIPREESKRVGKEGKKGSGDGHEKVDAQATSAAMEEESDEESDDDESDEDEEEDEDEGDEKQQGADVTASMDHPRRLLHLRLFTMLLRYRSLQGDGFQAAIGPPVWTALRKFASVACEGFASPLNAYLPAFCSGFADVDACFGSRGSFFGFKPLGGSFAANPPFVHSTMDAAAEHMISLLQAATEAPGDHALSFIVILPGWTESAAFTALSESPFLRKRVLIAAADHGFCDGAAFQRQDPFRASPFDTSVFVMQTDKASRKWPCSADKFEVELRAAFASCMPSASAVERQLKRDAGARPKTDEPKGGKGARKRPRVGVDGSGKGGGKQYDAETEAALNRWVQFKRKGNYEKADELRTELAAKGVNTDIARPAPQRRDSNKKAKSQDP